MFSGCSIPAFMSLFYTTFLKNCGGSLKLLANHVSYYCCCYEREFSLQNTFTSKIHFVSLEFHGDPKTVPRFRLILPPSVLGDITDFKGGVCLSVCFLFKHSHILNSVHFYKHH